MRMKDLQEGFTFLEGLLVALALATIGFALLYFGSAFLRAESTARGKSAAAVKILTFDRYIRSQAGEIQPPFWGGKFDIAISGQNADINYFAGDATKILSLKGDSEGLSVTTPHGTFSTKGIRIESLSTVVRDGRVVGLRLHIAAYGESFEILAPFGSFTLRDKSVALH